MAVVVLSDGSQRAQDLAKTLGLALVDQPKDYYLVFEKNKWRVRDARQGTGFEISVDLQQQYQAFKKQKINPKKDILSRALDYKGQENFIFIDGTLGFAKDSLHMLSMGANVIGVERNPLPHFLVSQSLRESQELQGRLTTYCADVSDLLPTLMSQSSTLYLDPMFENAKNKSAPKKNLALLREISPIDADVQGVIEKAIKLGVKRVVVKRPLKGQQLYGKPNIVYQGKLIRYDVYTR